MYIDVFSKNIRNVTICAWPYRTFKVMSHLARFQEELEHFTLTLSEVQKVESFSHHHSLQVQ